MSPLTDKVDSIKLTPCIFVPIFCPTWNTAAFQYRHEQTIPGVFNRWYWQSIEIDVNRYQSIAINRLILEIDDARFCDFLSIAIDDINPFTPIRSKRTFSQPFQEKCTGKVVRVDGVIIFHLSKLWKAKFSILCYVIFLVRLQGKFEVDHSWEWKG